MQRIKFIYYIIGAILITFCILSCVGNGGYWFEINNYTDSAVTIITNQWPSNYTNPNANNYRIKADTDSVKNYVWTKNDMVYVLPEHTTFGAGVQMEFYWDDNDLSGNPEADGVIPLWNIIKEIKIGNRNLSPEIWSNKNKWIINNYSDIEITYSLNISDGKKDYRDHKD